MSFEEWHLDKRTERMFLQSSGIFYSLLLTLVTYMLPYRMTIAVREYLDEKGASPFAHWFDRLDAAAAAKVATALYRLKGGNFSRVEGIGGGVHECKINFGPGYRIFSEKMAKNSLSCLAAAQKNGKNPTSRRHWLTGRIIRGVNTKR